MKNHKIKKEIIKICKSRPNIMLIHADCPDFKENDRHEGYISTTLRFRPLFNSINYN